MTGYLREGCKQFMQTKSHKVMPLKMNMGDSRIKLISFESWVSTDKAFNYAKHHTNGVPFLLVDRSPCPDLFFDPFEVSDHDRVCVISGLCRGSVPGWFPVK